MGPAAAGIHQSCTVLGMGWALKRALVWECVAQSDAVT